VDPTQAFLACGATVRFGCGHFPCCTAAWRCFEHARQAGRSSRPRYGCVSVACSTRIRHAGIERPAVGAAATIRWSVRRRGSETQHSFASPAFQLKCLNKQSRAIRRYSRCMPNPIARASSNQVSIPALRTPNGPRRSIYSRMRNNSFSPTGHVFIAREHYRVVQFFRGHLGIS
jgi:hypothetical protein